MKKYLNAFLALAMLLTVIVPSTTNAANGTPFNQSYIGWNYGKEGQTFAGIIPALGDGIEMRPWKFNQWIAFYHFDSGTITQQSNYDVFTIKKQYKTDNFDKENGFGLIHKSDASVGSFFDIVMKDEGAKYSSEQMSYFRDAVVERSYNTNLKKGHPSFFNVEMFSFLHVPTVIQWMGGKFERVEKASPTDDAASIARYSLSLWPKLFVDSSTSSVKLTYIGNGYTDRTMKVWVTKRGEFPNVSSGVQLLNRYVTSDSSSLQDSLTTDANTIIQKLGTEEVDFIFDDGYGRVAIEPATLKGGGGGIDSGVDFVPTKLNLTDSGQIWMTFRYDGDSTIKTADIQNKDGMPMGGTVKIGGAITKELSLGSMFTQLPSELKSGSTHNVMLGKMDLGTKPGKYYIKITGIVNNPNHPKRATESPAEAYKNNSINGQWLREIKIDDHDLIAISIATTPSTMTHKQTTTVKAQVKNLGPTAQQDVRIRFFSNGQQIYEARKDMPANKTIEVGGFTYKPGAAGTYSISVHVDPLGEKKDKNRANNVATTGCLVTNGDAAGQCTTAEVVRGNWDVSYPLITGYPTKWSYYTYYDSKGNPYTSSYSYTDYNDPIWSTRTVNYWETLTSKGSVNTKQGIPTDPDRPKESDRESRGSWEIIPYAQQNNLNPNEVTRAGYGFGLTFTTRYNTDWETKVPSGYENTARPIGTTPKGVQTASATIYDSAGKYVTTIQLDKTSDDGRNATFELPVKSYTDPVTNKTYNERKFLTDHTAPDGEYRIVVQSGTAGVTGISVCKTFYVTIYGSMYDDMQNLGVN